MIMIFGSLSWSIESTAKSRGHRKDEIPVMAWGPCVDEGNPSLEDFEGVKECGFNHAFYFGGVNAIGRVCGYAEKTGLNLLIGGPFTGKLHDSSDFDRFKGKDVIKGWYLVDEPHYDQLQMYKERYDVLKRLSPDKLIYMNLIGGVSPKFTGPCKSMSEYLDTIQVVFRPELWSYDYYPVLVNNDKISVNYYHFFSDLETFSRQAKKTGKPFWAFCQSLAFRNSSVERPPATVPYLRFEAFSALAYGAQGITYWRYSLSVSKDEEFLSALVDLEGNRTPAWYAARQVNGEIKLYNDVFYGCTLLDYQHTGSLLADKVKSSTHKFPYLQNVESGEYGFLFSHIKTAGKDYVVIVNHDVASPQEISLTFEDNHNVRLLLPKKNNKGLRETKIKKRFNTVVEPGAYLIFRIG